MNENNSNNPKVFLCHASEDKEIAEKIANTLVAKGIDTFFEKWEIRSGDSLRRKIEKGISDCTHFIVLCTENSKNKEWVNIEIDAGLVKSIEGKCKLIPLRRNLSIDSLTPILKSKHSPEIKNFEEDIKICNILAI